MMELKSLREKAEYTQETAAELLDISVSTIQNWEKNGAACPPEKLNRVMDLYGVKEKERDRVFLSLYRRPYQHQDGEEQADNFPYFLFDRDSDVAKKAAVCRFSEEEMEIFGYVYYLDCVDMSNSSSYFEGTDLEGAPARWALDYQFLMDHGGVFETLGKIDQIYGRFPSGEMRDIVYNYGLEHPGESFSFCEMPPAFIRENLPLFSKNVDIRKLYSLCKSLRNPVLLGTTRKSYLDKVPDPLKQITTKYERTFRFFQEEEEEDGYSSTVLLEEAPDWICSCIEMVKEESSDAAYLEVKSRYESDLAAFNEHPNLYDHAPSFEECFEYTVRLTEKGKQFLAWYDGTDVR
jgi:transcriptional regulator with XRE-family HTH domain